MTLVDGYALAVMVWYAGVEILHCEFCPDNISRWKRAKNFFTLEFWPLLLPCIAVKTLIQVARGADLKMLPPGDTGGEPKQIEWHCEIAEDPDLPDNDKPYGY